MTPALPPVLARVVQGGQCAGCGLCAGLDPGIGLARDEGGWWRPVARAAARPETDALMAAACPGARVAPWAVDRDVPVDPFWGPLAGVRTGHACDPDIRHTASSGGVLSALAVHLWTGWCMWRWTPRPPCSRRSSVRRSARM
jgi:coenzyme F420 hydrogenase subunit beta